MKRGTVVLIALTAAVGWAAPAHGHGNSGAADWRHKAPARHADGAHATRHGPGTPAIGTVRAWPSVTYDADLIVMKDFELRAVGPHIEVWVGTDLPVDSDECRSSNPANLVVTNSQARRLVHEFENIVRPIETKAFGTLRPRDGSDAQPELLDPSIPADAFRGDGRHVVVLVDNFRAGGWALPIVMQATDRNILSIKAQGWPNTFGAHPRSFGPDPCRTLNGYAVPHVEEALLAHEYNHLIKENRGGDGALGTTARWVSEGVAEWATVATGYIDAREDSIASLTVACFLGRQTQALPAGWHDPFGVQVGGPENSLTSFADPGQGSDCEYGPPMTLTLFLAARYGKHFVRDLLFTTGGSGITDGLKPTLARHGVSENPAAILRDWSTAMALDGVLDDGAKLEGAQRRDLQVRELHSIVNLETPFAYAAPGAPPNGADFVRLRSAGGRPLSSREISSVRFEAPSHYPPAPVEWTVDADGHGSGDAALYSGSGPELDRAIVRSITVDPSNPTLSFDARYDTEPDYDYGFVQVSTDGGATYHSRRATTTTSNVAPDADPGIVAELPGFNGDSGGWVHQTVDLSDLAGSQVLVAFRYKTDGFVDHPGFWIDNLAMGSTLVADGATLDGWKTATEIRPVAIARISLRLIAYDSRHRRAFVTDTKVDADNEGQLTPAQRAALRATDASTVAAIVNHYEPTEDLNQPAPYALTANGVLQPGGGTEEP